MLAAYLSAVIICDCRSTTTIRGHINHLWQHELSPAAADVRGELLFSCRLFFRPCPVPSHGEASLPSSTVAAFTVQLRQLCIWPCPVTSRRQGGLHGRLRQLQPATLVRHGSCSGRPPDSADRAGVTPRAPAADGGTERQKGRINGEGGGGATAKEKEKEKEKNGGPQHGVDSG